MGRDQVQHLEMARDIAARFNHLFGNGREHFVLPEVVVDEQVATLPGWTAARCPRATTTRFPLFEGGARGLQAALARVVTDSKLPGEAQDPDSAHLVTLYEAFANAPEREQFRADLKAGLGWGEAAARLRAARAGHRTDALALRATDAHPARIEEALMEGARKARAIAAPFLVQLREAVAFGA